MLLAALLTDPNLSPAFRRIFADRKEDMLTKAADKASPRRFTGEPLTGFGGIDEIGSDRWNEVRDQERADQRADEHRERNARGE